MKLLILVFTFIFITACNQELDNVKVKSLSNKKYDYSKNAPASIAELLGGKFQFVADVNKEQDQFVIPNVEDRIPLTEGYFYIDEVDPGIGEEIQYYDFTNKQSSFFVDLCPGACDTKILDHTWLDESLFILFNNSEYGTELLEITFEPFSLIIHHSVDGSSSLIEDKLPINDLNYKIYATNNSIIVQSNFFGTDYDIDLFDANLNEYIDMNNITVGYQDVDDEVLSNDPVSQIGHNDNFLIFYNGTNTYQFNEQTQTLNPLGIGKTRLSMSGTEINLSFPTSNIKGFTHDGVDYVALKGTKNINSVPRIYLYNLTNNSYILVDTQTNPANNGILNSVLARDGKIYFIGADPTDFEVISGNEENKIYVYDTDNYPSVAPGSIILANVLDYKFDLGGSDNTTYSVQNIIAAQDFFCFEDFEYADELHRTLFCHIPVINKTVQFHPGGFDQSGLTNEITAVGDLTDNNYSLDSFIQDGESVLNKIYIPMKYTSAWDYQIFELRLDADNIAYRKIVDYLPVQQNQINSGDINPLVASISSTYLSVQDDVKGVNVDIDLATNQIHNYTGSSFYAGVQLVSGSGLPIVHYIDNSIIFGEYSRYPASVKTDGFFFIIDRATNDLILNDKIKVSKDLLTKRIGDDFYFTAHNYIDDATDYENVVKYNVSTKQVDILGGRFRSFQSFTEHGGELVFVAKDTGADQYRVIRYNGSDGGILICPYIENDVFQSPQVIGDYLYCRNLGDSVQRYDESFSSSIVNNNTGTRHPEYVFTDGIDIYKLAMFVYDGKLIYTGENGSETYWIYDPNTNTNVEVTRETNGNKMSSQFFKAHITPENELYFHQTMFDDKENAPDEQATSITKLGGIGNNQAVDLTTTNDTVNTNNGYVLYTSAFDELFVKSADGNVLIHSDVTLGGNCSNILRGRPSFQHVNPQGKYALLYHHDQVGAGSVTNNTLCFFKDNQGINFGAYGFSGKNLELEVVFENQEFLIFQAARVDDNESMLIKIDLETLAVNFVTTFPVGALIKVVQIGKGVLFCGDTGVGVYDPYAQDPVIISAQNKCQPDSIYVDKNERKVYLAIDDESGLMGYELWSYCYAPGGNCSANNSVTNDLVELASISHEYVNNSVDQTITLNGSGFNNITDVQLEGNSCDTLTIVTDTELTCNIPTNSDGPADIQIITSSEVYLYDNAITYNPNATMTGYTTTSLSIGDTLGVQGTNFVPGARVYMDGTECTDTLYFSDQVIYCKVPIAITGTHNVEVRNGDGFIISQNPTFTPTSPIVSSVRMNADPSVDAFGPVAGGTTVLINGTNFDSGISIVEFNGELCTSIVVGGANNTITCNMPASVSGLGFVDLYVENLDGKNFSFSNAFEYFGPPTLSSVAPNRGPINGSQVIIIDGTNFRTGWNVDINGNNCPLGGPSNSTVIRCTTPDNTTAGGPYDIVVTNLDGQSATLTSAYSYIAPPSISSITPNYIDESNGGTITVNGSDFDVAGGVQFYDANFTLGCTITNLTANSFDCNYAAGLNYGSFDLSGVDVTVYNTIDFQSDTYAAGLAYIQDPQFNDISPTSTNAGTSTSVTINGFIGFGDGGNYQEIAGPAQVKIGGDDCTTLTVVDSDTITCTTPVKTAGTYDLEIILATGNTVTVSNAFTYNAVSSPTIDSYDYAFGPVAGGNTITITGTNFQPALVVLINNNVCSGGGYVSSTQATCVVPSGALGTYDVRINNPDSGTVTDSGAFEYVAAPTIGSFSPTTIVEAGSETLTINGTGFLANATVSIDGSACPTTTINPTSITCTTPSGTGSAVTVTVTNLDGQTGTNTIDYLPAPTITGLSTPTDIDGGRDDATQTLTINGTNFIAGNLSHTVSVNGSACAVTSVPDASTINCTLGSGTGTGSVTVTNPDGQVSNAYTSFTYHPLLSLSTVSPNSGPDTGSNSITINGADIRNSTNGGGVVTVSIEGIGCSVTAVAGDGSSVTCTVASGSHTPGAYDVTVTNGDGRSATLTDAYTFNAATVPATITNVTTSKANGVYGDSEVIDITVTFSEAITKGGGSTRIFLNNGADADYLSGNNSTQLVFRYTVANTDTDTATLSVTNYLSLGTTDADGDTFNSTSVPGGVDLADNGHNIAIDNTAPTISSITATNGNASYGPPSVIDIVVTFSEPVTASTSTLTLSNGATTSSPNVTNVGSITYQYTIANEEAITDLDVSTFGIGNLVDQAGNAMVDNTIPGGSNLADNKNIDIINLAPTVTGITRDEVSEAGGETITVNGTNFLSTAIVSIGGINCTPTSFVSDSELTCSTNSSLSAGLAQQLRVTNPDAQFANSATNVDVFGAPTITNVNPSVSAIPGGSSITIDGTNFYDGMDVNLVGRPCTSINIVNSNQLTCMATSNSGFGGAEQGDVVITNNAAQSVTSTNGFDYIDSPTITSISPDIIESGVTTPITITGTNFYPGVSVTVDGVACTGVSLTNNDTIDCIAPSRSTGPYDVVVTNATSQSVTDLGGLTYEPAPEVASTKADYTPGGMTNEGHNEGNYDIIITGDHFVNGATASVAGTPCDSTNFNSVNELVCSFSAGVYSIFANQPVVVTNPSGLSVTENIWEFYDRFSVSGFTPDRAISNDSLTGETITIAGNNFRNDGVTFSVEIDGRSCTSPVFSTNSFTCNIPALPNTLSPGLKNIVITSGDGDVITNPGASQFRYTDYKLYNVAGAGKSAVVSARDDNKIYVNGSLVDSDVDIGDIAYLSTTSQGDVIEAIYPLNVHGRLATGNSNVNEADVPWVGEKWAANEFIFVTPLPTGNRQEIMLYALETTTFTMTNMTQTNTIVSSEIRAAGSSWTVNLLTGTSSANDIYRIQAIGGKVLAFFMDTGFNASDGRTQVYPLMPPSNDIVGYASRQVKMYSNQPGTSEVAIIDTATVTNIPGDNPKGINSPYVANNLSTPFTANHYNGAAMRLISDKTITAMTFDDATGGANVHGAAATPFIPVNKFGHYFVLPTDAKFVTIVTAQPNAGVTINPSNGVAFTETFPTAGSWFGGHGLRPTYVSMPQNFITAIRLIDDGVGPVDLPYGTVIESPVPISVIYEPLNDNPNSGNLYSSEKDESIMYGFDPE